MQRILLGAFPEGGGKFGLRVSQPGYNVASNPVDNEQLIFNSDWPAVLPIHQIGQVSVSGGVSYDVTFPTLDYIPFVAALYKVGSEDWTAFSTINTLFVRQYTVWTGALNVAVNVYPLQQFSAAGDNYVGYLSNLPWYPGSISLYGNLTMRAFSNKLTISCSHNISVYYFIYRLRAF